MADIGDMIVKQIQDSLETLNPRGLKSIIDTEALAYAMYTVENRAIPNMIDGLKPVQRFVIARALEMAKGNKDKFHKLASIAGGVADLGYHHGEGSAESAAALMANTWNNIYPILDGQGNFGSRMVQEASAARYVFARVGKNFYDMYKDNEYAPKHKDEEHVPPAYYLPIIPMVLINGISGIATGYATDILPHDVASVKKSVQQALEGKKISEPKVAFPEFRGEIVPVDSSFELHGTYKFTSRTQMYITEIPYKYDREKYIAVLDALEDKGFITYEDACSEDGFGFKVKFRKDYVLGETDEERHAKIMKDFKLVERRSQNITVIDHNGKLREYENAADLIRDFVDVRLKFVQYRIDNKIDETEKAFKLALAKAKFIKDVIDGVVVVQGKTRKALTDELTQNETYGEFADRLVAMNIFHITSDEAKKLALEAKAKKEENDYWKNTDSKTEYLKDLKEL